LGIIETIIDFLFLRKQKRRRNKYLPKEEHRIRCLINFDDEVLEDIPLKRSRLGRGLFGNELSSEICGWWFGSGEGFLRAGGGLEGFGSWVGICGGRRDLRLHEPWRYSVQILN
jgi:hypothetical protein